MSTGRPARCAAAYLKEDACSAGDKTGQYKGVLDCFAKSYRQGGFLTFYNGFLPNFARLGSWNCAMFLTVEQVRLVSCSLQPRACKSVPTGNSIRCILSQMID